MRALPAILVLAALVAAAVFVADRPGSVVVVWQGWRVDTSVAVMVLAGALVAVAAAALFHLLRKLIGAPRAFLRSRHERRRRHGYRALAQGMAAVAAGDAEEARKLARKADVLLAEPPLTLLLSAQAAQLEGDEQAARKYFIAMLDRAETEFLGLRGLIMQALKGGDEATALKLAERARSLRPRTPWVLSSLFELQARAGDWAAAEATLTEAAKRKALPAPESRRHRAVLLHERSRLAENEGRQREALKMAAKAHALDPGFTPAAVRYASLLRVAGHRRHAVRVVEAGWRAAPHPELAAAYGELFADAAPLDRVKRFERLAALSPDHRESRLAAAEAALRARLWGEARRHLQAAGAEGGDGPVPPRVCRLMAELEESEHGDHAASRAWLARAAAAPLFDPTYVCGACGAETPQWAPLCPHCRAFGSLVWRMPGGTQAPRLAAAVGALSPPLPVPAPWPTTPMRPATPRDATRAPAAVDDAEPGM